MFLLFSITAFADHHWPPVNCGSEVRSICESRCEADWVDDREQYFRPYCENRVNDEIRECFYSCPSQPADRIISCFQRCGQMVSERQQRIDDCIEEHKLYWRMDICIDDCINRCVN